MPTTKTSERTASRDAVWIKTQTGSGNPSFSAQAAGQNYVLPQTVTLGDSPQNWRERIKQCRSATSSLDGDSRTYDFPNSNFAIRDDVVTLGSQKGKVRRRTLYGAIEGTAQVPAVNPALLDATILKARAGYAKRALAEQQKVQSLVALGEIGQTVRMIRNAASLLNGGAYRYLASLLKRRKRYPRKKLRHVISESWLEFSFGWQPLINDIDGMAHALAEATVNATKRFQRISYRANYPSVSGGILTTVDHTAGGNLLFRVHRREVRTTVCHARFSGAVNLQPPGTNAVTNQFGLRLRDIVPSLWELIPYSFAVDYFTNIGDMIAAYSLMQSDLRWTELGWSCESTNIKSVDSVEFGVIAGESLASSSYRASGIQRLTAKSVHRENYVGSFVPPFQFEVPGATSRKWLNIAALLTASRRTSKQLSAY